MDTVSKSKRREIMQAIKSKWTGPEKRVYQAMKDEGLRPTVHEDDLPGKPDFVFMGSKVAVFCDSHFWHGYDWLASGRAAIKCGGALSPTAARGEPME